MARCGGRKEWRPICFRNYFHRWLCAQHELYMFNVHKTVRISWVLNESTCTSGGAALVLNFPDQ